MKRIGVSIQNRVFSESIMMMLTMASEFRPVRLPPQSAEKMLIECEALSPEILLMDVAAAPQEITLEKRMDFVSELNRAVPDCKTALLCDETAYPEVAREVMRAKQVGRIDAFFYASVTSEYLMAALNAL